MVDNNELKRSVIKIVEGPVKLLDSNWEPEMTVKEGDNVDLKTTINKPTKSPDDVVIVKDGERISPRRFW